MTWVLVDIDGLVRNFVVWDGQAEYDPTPLVLHPYKDGLEIGQPYADDQSAE